MLELVAWHRLKTIHPSNTTLLKPQGRLDLGTRARLPIRRWARSRAVRAQLRKHGSPGRAYVTTFLHRLATDLRDQAIVRRLCGARRDGRQPAA